MKKMLLVGLIPIGLIMIAQCAPAQIEPTYGDYSAARPDRFERAAIEDRFVVIQRRIDEYRKMVRLSEEEAGDFQVRLDTIKRDYLRVMEGARFMKYEDTEISRRLHLLERDLDRYRW